MGKRRHILVVDSDLAALTWYHELLRQADFQVQTATSADQMAALLEQEDFTLLLLDLHTIGNDNHTRLQHIQHAHPDLPCILMADRDTPDSGAALLETFAALVKLGIQYLLLKPFADSELYSAINDSLQQQRMRRTRLASEKLHWLTSSSHPPAHDLSRQHVAGLIVETVNDCLEADQCHLLAWDDQTQALRLLASTGADDKPEANIPLAQHIGGWIARYRQPLLLGSKHNRPHDLRRAPLAANSALGVPLLAGEHLLGVLYAEQADRQQTFTSTDQEMLTLLGQQASQVLHHTRQQTELSTSHDLHRSLIQHHPDAVFLLDASGQHVLDANPTAEQLTGYDHAELLAITPDTLLVGLEHIRQHDDIGSYTSSAVWHNVTYLQKQNSTVEPLIRAKNGHKIAVSFSFSRFSWDGQPMLLIVAHNISHYWQLTRELIQREKLTAIGRLVSGIAHEINNPLQAIHNSLHLLVNSASNGNNVGNNMEKRQRYLSMAHQEVQHLINIVQRVLEIYRPSQESMRPIDMHDLLRAVLQVLDQEFASSAVQVVLELHPRLPLVWGISSHLKQACLSLLLNAVEAMQNGGVLTLRTYVTLDTPVDDAGWIEQVEQIDTIQPEAGTIERWGHYIRVVVEISDTGCGIPPDELTKVFEPFYKSRSNGVGLGLAISYSIIEQHHGTLSASSTVGQGSTFRISLPIAT